MSEDDGARDLEIPTFAECVVGYRAWLADEQDRLWPIGARRRPWEPGVNTARCNCGTWDRLRFEWSEFGGRRILEPAPPHLAPEDDCTCGLYSWRRPSESWWDDPAWLTPPRVAGAVACWGRMQVHGEGFRAEHACVVTLAYAADAGSGALRTLERIARRYRVDLVSLDDLESAASSHGEPLPEDFGPPPAPAPAPTELTALDEPRAPEDGYADETGFVHARDATPDEVPPVKRDPRLQPAEGIIPPGFGSYGGFPGF